MSLRHHMLIIIACVAVQACNSKEIDYAAKSGLLLELQPGMSRAAVENRLGSRPLHQFTCLQDDELYLCTSHWFPGIPRPYLVYRNDRLEKITAARAWPGLDQEDGDDPQRRIEWVLEQSPLPRGQIEQQIADAKRNDALAKAYSEPGMLLFAEVLTAPFAPLDWWRQSVKKSKYRVLADRYDPMKSIPGMTIAQVDAVYGSPVNIISGSVETRVYGEHSASDGFADYKFAWVAVQCRDGRVVRVLSHDFLTETMMAIPARGTYE